MKITLQELENLLIEKAKKLISNEEAEYFAELQLDTHLKKFPRTDPLKKAIGDLENWKDKDIKGFTKVVDAPSVTIFDCHGLSPSPKLLQIHNELVAKARKTGVSAVGVINSGGFHTLALWTDLLSKQGVIGICASNGGPAAVVPFGAKGGKTQAVFGTNPFSYSIPTDNGPLTTDMASSKIPFSEIVSAKSGETALSPNAAVKEDGEPAEKADETLLDGEIANLMPLGGDAKGTALVTLFEVLTSSLIGSPNSIEMDQEAFVPAEHGNLLIAFDIGTFTKERDFLESTSRLAKKISGLNPKDGVEKVYYPGERSQSKKKSRTDQETIDIDDDLILRLKSI